MSDQRPPPDAEIVLEPQPAALDDRLKRLEASLAGMQTRALVPTATEDQLAERVLGLLTARAAEHRAANGVGPPGLVPVPPVAAVPPDIGGPANGQSLWKWFVAGIVGEVTVIARMYFDPRYRLSRVAQFGVPAVLVLFVLNYFLFSVFAIPVLSPVLERLVCVFLSLVLYKVLVREVGRYRQVLSYLAQWSG